MNRTEDNLSDSAREIGALRERVRLLEEERDAAQKLTLSRDSDRSPVEEALLESEERFRILSEAMPQVVWWSDSEGRANYLNAHWFAYTGQTHEEAKDLGWLGCVHPEDLPRAQERWTAAVMTGTPYEAEYRLRGKNRLYRWFLSRGLPFRDAAGRIVHWFGTCTDITEHKNLERALAEAKGAAEEAARAKSEFMANMSHEIRTPMTVIMAALEHLLHIDVDPERRHLLEMADQATLRLRALIDDILDFSRIEAHRMDLEKEPFPLRECLGKAVTKVAARAREKCLDLQWDIPPDIPSEVVGDQGRLGQVLFNLIDNAVKFTHEGGVTVSVTACNKGLEFTVADTGIGIPVEKRELIFQTFRQVDSSLTRKYGGTGLGLAITKGLVELMGGQIGLRGREGRGSAFYFTLPLEAAEVPLPRAAEVCPGAGGRINSGVRILLAEDDPMIRDMIRLLLDRRGWLTETAENGREAVFKWQADHFDLILMDVHMPEITGLEAAREIRALERQTGGRTPIIALTADARGETRRECLAGTMDCFLTKPVQVQALYAAIDKCLAS
jgi:PAS domain S-box-containing protein